MEEENLHCILVRCAEWAQTATASWFVEEWYWFSREQKYSLSNFLHCPLVPAFPPVKLNWKERQLKRVGGKNAAGANGAAQILILSPSFDWIYA